MESVSWERRPVDLFRGMRVTTDQEIPLCLGIQAPSGMGIGTPLFSRERVKVKATEAQMNEPICPGPSLG